MPTHRTFVLVSLAAALLGTRLTLPARAAGGDITSNDIAAGDGAGITYRRTPSASNALFDAIKMQPT